MGAGLQHDSGEAVNPAFIRFLLGDESATTLEAIRAQAMRWVMQAGEDRPIHLNRMLGLGGPRLVRAELRHHHLGQAMGLMPGPTSWRQRVQLAEAVRTFEARRWPTWRKLDAPPPHASTVDQILWAARQFGPLAATPEAYLDLSEP